MGGASRRIRRHSSHDFELALFRGPAAGWLVGMALAGVGAVLSSGMLTTSPHAAAAIELRGWRWAGGCYAISPAEADAALGLALVEPLPRGATLISSDADAVAFIQRCESTRPDVLHMTLPSGGMTRARMRQLRSTAEGKLFLGFDAVKEADVGELGEWFGARLLPQGMLWRVASGEGCGYGAAASARSVDARELDDWRRRTRPALDALFRGNVIGGRSRGAVESPLTAARSARHHCLALEAKYLRASHLLSAAWRINTQVTQHHRCMDDAACRREKREKEAALEVHSDGSAYTLALAEAASLFGEVASRDAAATGAKYACGSRSSRRNVLFNRALATLRAVAATAEWRPPTDALRAAAFAKAEALLVDALGDFVAAFPEDEQGESFRTVLNAPRYRRQLEAKRRKRSDEDTATGAAV